MEYYKNYDMRIFFCILLIAGCGLFNPAKYNPNPVVPDCHEEPAKVDTIRLTNGVDTIIILDTLKRE
jgi:hypothetical protein